MKEYKNLSNLEADAKFKKKYLPKYFWFRNPGIFPPSSLIFLALLGLVYLLNSDMLISLYAIPFAVILLLGAIWLKTTKKIILNRLYETPDSYKICISKPISKDNDTIFLIFSKDSKRHNKHFIQSAQKDMVKNGFVESDMFSTMKQKIGTEAQPVSDEYTGGWDNIFITCMKKSDLNKSDALWKTEGFTFLLYINDKEILPVKRKDLASVL